MKRSKITFFWCVLIFVQLLNNVRESDANTDVPDSQLKSREKSTGWYEDNSNGSGSSSNSCSEDTILDYCAMHIFNKEGMLKKFDESTQLLWNTYHFLNSKSCNILICVKMMQALILEADQFLPKDFKISDNELKQMLRLPSTGKCTLNQINEEKTIIPSPRNDLNVERKFITHIVQSNGDEEIPETTLLPKKSFINQFVQHYIAPPTTTVKPVEISTMSTTAAITRTSSDGTTVNYNSNESGHMMQSTTETVQDRINVSPKVMRKTNYMRQMVTNVPIQINVPTENDKLSAEIYFSRQDQERKANKEGEEPPSRKMSDASDNSNRVEMKPSQHLLQILIPKLASEFVNTTANICEQQQQKLDLLLEIANELKENSLSKGVQQRFNLIKGAQLNLNNLSKNKLLMPLDIAMQNPPMVGQWNISYIVKVGKDNAMNLVPIIDSEKTLDPTMEMYPIPDLNQTTSLHHIVNLNGLLPHVARGGKADKFDAIGIMRKFKNGVNLLNDLGYKIIFNETDTSDSVRIFDVLLLNIRHILDQKADALSPQMVEFFQNYLRALLFAGKEMDSVSEATNKNLKAFRAPNLAEIKMTKTVNLTDYLMSALNTNKMPAYLLDDLYKLYDFLLVDLGEEHLKDFFPATNNKGDFLKELFGFLQQSKAVDTAQKNLLTIFSSFIKK